MIGPVVERHYGQGVDAPLGGADVRLRLHAAAVADPGALERWLVGSPEDRVVVAVIAIFGGILVLYRDREADVGGC